MPEEKKPEEKAAKEEMSETPRVSEHAQKSKISDKPKAAKALAKGIKKKWYNIVSPEMFRDFVIGETFVAEPSIIVGKTLSINLMTLTNDIKKQNINLKFLVNRVENETGIANVVGYELVPSSVRRLVRRGKQRIDPSFVCHTSDNIRVRVKPLLLAAININNSVLKSLRKASIDFITSGISKTSYPDLINSLMSYGLQKELRDHLKKIYPLKICEIREMKIEREKRSEDKVKKKELRKEIKKEAKEEPKEEKPDTEEKKEAKSKEKKPEIEEKEEVAVSE